MYALYSGYNAIGQPATVTFGNGVTTAYQYNSASNRLKNITTAKGAQALINLNYSFDKGKALREKHLGKALRKKH